MDCEFTPAMSIFNTKKQSSSLSNSKEESNKKSFESKINKI